MKLVLATLALLALGFILQLNLLIYALYVLLAILLLGRFFTRTWAESVSAVRSPMPELVNLGQQVESSVELTNAGAYSIPWLLLEDAVPRDALVQMPPRLKAEGQRLTLVRLRRGEKITLQYRVTFLMRGYYQIGPLLAETGDVFGLHRRFRVLSEPQFVLVLPKVLPLEGYHLASRRPLGELRLTHQLFEDPTRMAGLRAYQPGDPVNRIDWRATARSGEMQSRTYESTAVTGATFLLDFHRVSFPPSALLAAELAVVTVASLASAVQQLGQQIGLVTNGRDAADRIREEGWEANFLTRQDAMQRSVVAASTRLQPVMLEAARGENHFFRLLATLGRLEQTDGLEFAALIEETAARISREAKVVAVLGLVTPAIAAALGNLVRRGLVVTAIVVSFKIDALPDWARPPDWAEMLISQGVDFRLICSEEGLSQLCAEAIVK